MNYAFHARMVRLALGSEPTVAFAGPTGDLVWINAEDDREAVATILADPPADRSGVVVEALGDGRSVATCALPHHQPSAAGAIVVIFDGPVAALRNRDEFTDLLADIAATIGSEVELRNEVDELTGKLQQQHKELSLMYEADDGPSGHRKIEESLRRIIRTCVGSQDINTALLLLPQRKLWLCEFDGTVLAATEDDGLQPGIEELYRRVVDSGGTLVLNEPEHSATYLVDPVPPSKLIACPVLDALSNTCGVLACLKRDDKPDFPATERKLIEAMAKHLSKVVVSGQDALTGVMNRANFEHEVRTALVATRQGRAHCVLALVAIDHFTQVNDLHGIQVGDGVLRQFASLVKAHAGDDATVARMYGDRFSILFSNMQLSQAQERVEAVQRAILATRFAAGDSEVELAASIGIMALRPTATTLSEVLTSVDIACQMAKELGGNRLEIFQPNSAALLRRRGEIRSAGQVDAAIKTDMFELFCQPIMPLHGSHMHFEILLRLRDANNDFLPPSNFIPAAERYNRMANIDRWVLQTALRQLEEARETLERENISWGINLSGQSLADNTFTDFVAEHLADSTIPPDWVYFEITETVAIRNFVDALRFIDRLTDLGYAFALDDFGAGYSSFGYLKQLPVDYLKIDGAFVKQLDSDEFNRATVSAIHRVAQTRKMETIAEFVENDKILDALYDLGVDFAQGYGIGKPRQLSQVMAELRRDSRAALDRYIYRPKAAERVGAGASDKA